LYDYASKIFENLQETTMTLHEREENAILHTYKRLPVEIVRGEGMYLYDTNGNAYLDFLGGVAVNALGYGHQGLLNAISEQAGRYIHISNYFVQQPQVELAEKLKSITGYSRVFFCNSGTEASEGALKLARKWGNTNGRSEIVTMQDSFHGRTMGSLSMMTNADYREGFGPFLEGCVNIPLNDIEALNAIISNKTAAVFLECMQGEGGIHELTLEFANRLTALKQQFGFLLIADEVQSGIGRTGKFLACEHYKLRPDIVTLAKPLGGGLPLGAILVSDELKDLLKPGNHGTTFGGNPVACAAGKVVLNEVVDNGLMVNVRETGSYFVQQLTLMKASMPDLIKEVRGKGLMIGAELTFEGKSVVDAMLERKILINCTHKNVLRFLPPIIVGRTHVDDVCGTLKQVLETSHVVAEVSH
jgi:predicted acetylornithine/succinylornithine family transaminase